MQLSTASCYFLCFGSDIFLCPLFLHSPQSMNSFTTVLLGTRNPCPFTDVTEYKQDTKLKYFIQSSLTSLKGDKMIKKTLTKCRKALVT
jgi:hypothetical protein